MKILLRVAILYFLLGAIGIGLFFVLRFYPLTEVSCGPDVMQPGDVCRETRSGVTTTYTYEQMKERPGIVAWVALGGGVLSVAYAIFKLVRARNGATPAASSAV
jgi:hypothetical protein